MIDERQPCLVIALKGDAPSAPLLFIARDGEFFDGFDWSITGEWMEIFAVFMSAGKVREEKRVLRAVDVDSIWSSTATPQKDRSEG